jgi:DNA repair exonuclease SbcCD ATPase subunit
MTQGCAYLKSYDAEAEEKNITGFDTNPKRQMDFLEKENKRIKAQNELLYIQVNQLENQIQRIMNENKNDMAIVKHEYKLMHEQIERLQEENQRMKQGNGTDTARIKDQNEILNQQINLLREENRKIISENKTRTEQLRDQNELLSQQINKIREQNKKIRDKNETLKTKIKDQRNPSNQQITKLGNRKKAMMPQMKSLPKSEIKIKVSCGDGNLGSANEMAKRLRKMGYKTQLIDYASQSDFELNTVYFSRNLENEAKHLSTGLGSNTLTKPMNRASEFDIIVVTGKNGFDS